MSDDNDEEAPPPVKAGGARRNVPNFENDEKQPPAPAPVELQRRVYALPQELVERIVEFQKEKGFSSEVEAARRLLDDALKSRDDLSKIISRFLTRLGALRIASEVAKDILVGHPLVQSLSFPTIDCVAFAMRDGFAVRIYDNGSVAIVGKNDQVMWTWKPAKIGEKFGPGKVEMVEDNDIPF